MTELILVVYRYLSGRPLDGVARTDGGYLRRGRARGYASAWSRRPGWQRQAYRVTVPLTLLALYRSYTVWPAVTRALAATAALFLATAAGRWVRRMWRTRRLRAIYVRPTLRALAGALGDAPVRLHVDPSLGSILTRMARPMSPVERAAREWYGQHLEPAVRWLPDRIQRGAWKTQVALKPLTTKLALFRVPRENAGPRIELTTGVPYLTSEQRQYVSSVVGAKIPAGDLVEHWDQIGTSVTARWTVRRRPPSRVGYADLAARIEQLAEWEFFLGLGVGDKPVIISLKDDSPHFACSAGTGAGKSVLAQLLGVQVLARGGQVVILDRKGSHRWALGLPGVDYCTRPEQMHEALIRLADLADRRNGDALHEAEDWDPGPRILVIAEELNATFAQLRDYWAEVRDRDAVKTSPAIKAFRNLLFMGRSAKENVFAVAQMLTANTTGGPESRENFGVRCLARYTKNNWKMLVPEAAMPRPSHTLGRWQIVRRGVATECQVCYLTTSEARLLVTKLRGVADVADSPLIGADQEMSQRLRQDAPQTPLLVSLRGFTERGVVPWSYDVTRKRIERARKAERPVPEPVKRDGTTDLYRLNDLVEWAESELVSP